MAYKYFEEMTVQYMTYTAFEDLLAEKYPYLNDYEFVPSQESSNDVTHMFYIKNEWDAWDQEEWDELQTDHNYNYQAGLLLQKLCVDGHIPAGTYLIDVSW